MSAYRDGDRIVVLLPTGMRGVDEKRWIATMLTRLQDQERRRRPSDALLLARANELSRRYLGGVATPASVRWVDNQSGRWGSCTPLDSSIRLSHRLQGMPEWVLDYVLLHELAHLLEPGHGPSFWQLLERFPKLERARGYLEGVAFASRTSAPDTVPDTSLGDRPDDGDTSSEASID